MKIQVAIFLVVTAIFANHFGSTVNAQFTDESDQPAAQAVSADPTKATLADVAWIAGHWQGEALGGSFEETWNPPFGGSMVGMFKFVKNDRVAFYELLTIVEENESLVLRLKHFNGRLVGWEDEEKSLEFPLVSVSAAEVVFEGLKFIRIDDTAIKIVVTQHKDGESKELIFPCKLKQ